MARSHWEQLLLAIGDLGNSGAPGDLGDCCSHNLQYSSDGDICWLLQVWTEKLPRSPVPQVAVAQVAGITGVAQIANVQQKLLPVWTGQYRNLVINV